MLRFPTDKRSIRQVVLVVAGLAAFAAGTQWVANYLDRDSAMVDLRDAVVRGDVETVKRFERRGIDWRDLTNYDQGYSALHRAARNGRLEMVQYLVENGADPAGLSADGATPLRVAVDHEHRDVIVYLAEKTLTPEVIDRMGDVRDVQPDFLRWLSGIEGVTFSLPPDVAYLALQVAVAEEDEAFVSFLLQAGTPPGMASGSSDEGFLNDAPGSDIRAPWLAPYCARPGSTPLHTAARLGHERITALLLDYGADPAKGDDEGKTPIDIASEQGHAAVVITLQEASESSG